MTPDRILVLGIGNTLLGDEGAGVHVVRRLMEAPAPPGVEFLDGGTGSLVLLEPMQDARRIILVDATADGEPPGTLRRLAPKFASDFPPSLAAHDIGLKDLLDSFYLMDLGEPDVVLFTLSIALPQDMTVDLSPALAEAVPGAAAAVLAELAT
ncbi:hydrogenase maturation protease [Geothrix sp. 21YS21S-2]|uniref:hydrogenase maturation protease n=1 Tax=Geothrix sp. 21YS21S-2 TaxID=3068893 RepID=UPI0027BAF72C|nr:hydrogenase maturation protease [Geothrix sp. 21YS21S-2]